MDADDGRSKSEQKHGVKVKASNLQEGIDTEHSIHVIACHVCMYPLYIYIPVVNISINYYIKLMEEAGTPNWFRDALERYWGIRKRV